MAEKPDPPIQIGEPIPGTDLVRRWQGGMEIAPMYSGDTRYDPDCDKAAMNQADRAGYCGVFVAGIKYVKLFGEWCVWAHRDFARQGTLAETETVAERGRA